MRYLLTNKKDIKDYKFPFETEIQNLGGLLMLKDREAYLQKMKGFHLIHDGYLRDLKKSSQDLPAQWPGIIEAIALNWPLPENITGSFSASLIDEQNGIISLCTDNIGLYPLYYLMEGEYFFISNSIITIGIASGAATDKAGIVQRAIGPEYANLGSRTILKNCKRLLPGECLRFDFEGNLLNKKYDNSLYQNLTSPSLKEADAKKYWKSYQTEVEYCVGDSKFVNIALSGGIDSRLAFGAIPSDKKINAYTFGKPENYESRLASRLARIRKAEFHPCYKPEVYFPSLKTLREYTAETEGVELCSWLEITESVHKAEKEPLLLGELCEALPGRKIEKFASKNFRKKNFFKYYVFQKAYDFKENDLESFSAWKKNVLHRFKIYYIDRHLSKFDLEIDREGLVTCLEADLNEIFERIEAHKLPYQELYDELFSWYTYTRMHLSRQLLTANKKFNAFSPAMSLQMLQKTSSLHPNIRLNYRFARKIFTENKDLAKLYSIPTNQAPIIPQYFPDIIKFGVWGLRSGIDQILIKRMMKSKDPQKLYRLFPSINWARVYHHPDMEKNLKAYFKRNHLGGAYFEQVYNQAVERKQLKQWPFANINIMNAASLNMELELIENFKS